MGGRSLLLYQRGCSLSLILSMRVGHDFYVGNTRFVVSKSDNPYHFVLRREDGRFFEVTDQRWTFIRRDIRVQAGVPRNPEARIIGVVVDAPRDIRILRGSLQRRSSCESCGGSKKLVQRISCGSCGGHGCSLCGGSGYVNDTFPCPDC